MFNSVSYPRALLSVYTGIFFLFFHAGAALACALPASMMFAPVLLPPLLVSVVWLFPHLLRVGLLPQAAPVPASSAARRLRPSGCAPSTALRQHSHIRRCRRHFDCLQNRPSRSPRSGLVAGRFRGPDTLRSRRHGRGARRQGGAGCPSYGGSTGGGIDRHEPERWRPRTISCRFGQRGQRFD